MECKIQVGDALLLGVPAVHYRGVFAEKVFELCHDPRTRPEAIAVEMEPGVVEEVVSWMKEMRIGSQESVILPCMLGVLVTRNSEEPENSLLCLSSTDSIIEAIRCAVELKIPVYGIDTEEFPLTHMDNYIMEDPLNAKNDLQGYVIRNAAEAMRVRDPEVDARREQVMVHRLRKILLQYKTVVYTGGLAHWEPISNALTSGRVLPETYYFSWESISCKRVVVHPQIATKFMDIYPVASTIYEWNRERGLDEHSYKNIAPDLETVCREILDTAYNTPDTRVVNQPGKDPLSSRYQGTPEFERMIQSMRLINQEKVPGSGTLLGASQAMMPSGFLSVMSVCIMDLKRPWAKPEDYFHLPVLIPASSFPDQESDDCQGFRVDLMEPIDDYSLYETGYVKTRSFILPFPPQGKSPVPNTAAKWFWKDQPKEKSNKFNFNSWVWPPCESLLYGIAFQAARIAGSSGREKQHTVFEGSLYDGVDMKATIRSAITGENRVHVKISPERKSVPEPDGKKTEPTVFIFDENKTIKNADWLFLMAGSTVGDHMKDKKKFDRIAQERGTIFIPAISMYKYVSLPEDLSPFVDSMEEMYGTTIFGNPCLNSITGANWLEDNDYACCPTLSSSSMRELVRYYQEEHNFLVDLTDWQSALILFALPYVKNRLVILAPDKFIIRPEFKVLATARKIELVHMPLSHFPKERITEIRKRYLVRSLDKDGCTYSKDTEAMLGQKQDCYMDLLPAYMRRQYERSKKILQKDPAETPVSGSLLTE